VPNAKPPPQASAGFGDAVQIEAAAKPAQRSFFMGHPYQETVNG